MQNKKCLIIANGDLPKKSDINRLKKIGFSSIFCADGGANSAYKLNIIPNYIIGDFDSIKDEVLNYYEGKSNLIRYTGQNDTDVEKVIKFVIKKGFKKVVLLGAAGNRVDHSFCNLSIILKYSDKINAFLMHRKSFVSVETGNIEIVTTPNEIISLYGFDDKTSIKSSGLKYPLNKISLPFGKKESTSNVAIGNKVKLNIINGKIFIIRDFKEVLANGYLQ